MSVWKYVVASGILSLWGCSDSSSVAGNSAETGSPELAGVLFLEGGKPAALARVQCVPSGFDAMKDVLPGQLQSMTDDSGSFSLVDFPSGRYSLEAFDPKSGKMLLVQGIDVPDSGRVVISDTLQRAGYALLDMGGKIPDGIEGSALVAGTTVNRFVKVEDGFVLVDSLPPDTLDLKLYLNGGEYRIDFENVVVPSADTVKVKWQHNASADTVVFSFRASLAFPSDADTSLGTYSSDIPLALRLDSANCNFDDFDGLEGRWEVYRISPDGSRSKSLPISPGYFDVQKRKALFWTRVDSLNVTDSLELMFNSGKEPLYALDVFPTSRSYGVVYHFDNGLENIEDVAEKQNYTGTGVGLRETEGVLGSAAFFDGTGYVVVEGSAESDTARKTHLNFGYSSGFNISAWVKLDDLKKSQTILAKGESLYNLHFSPDSGFVAEVFHEAEAYKDSSSDTASYRVVVYSGMDGLEACQWNFISFNGAVGFNLFVNGRTVPRKYEKVPWEGIRSESSNLEIGRGKGPEGAETYLKGSLDELTISGSSRPDAWTMATYLNQRPGDVWPKMSSVRKF